MARDRTDLIHRVARAISARRRALGLTQEALADRLELAVKNVQRIEAGAQNLTLASLERICKALEIPPATLFGAEPLPATSPAGANAVEDLRAAGYSVREASLPGRRSTGAIPITTIAAAAGVLESGARSVEAVGWLTLPSKEPPSPGQFVARVNGKSMEPRIKHGSLCLFGPPAPPPYRARIFLVGHPALADSDLDGPFALKRIALRKRDGRTRVTLLSQNPDFAPLPLDPPAADLRIVAELNEILTPRPR